MYFIINTNLQITTQYTNQRGMNVKKGGQVGVTLLYSRLQMGHYNV